PLTPRRAATTPQTSVARAAARPPPTDTPPPRRDGYHRLESRVLSALPQDHESLALDGLPRLEAQDCRLVRFVERDEDKACGTGQAALGLQNAGSGLDLVRSQRVQRVPRGRDG